MAELNIGDKVVCKSHEIFEKGFIGTVEKVYENSAKVHLDDIYDQDDIKQHDLNDVLVVSFKQLKRQA